MSEADPLDVSSLGERAALARIEQALFGQGPAPVLVGRYEVLEALGSGAFGRVYRARDPQLDREVAVKVLPGSGDDQERLLREATVMATVSHPNVAAIYDAGVVGEGADGRVFLVLELVEGQHLGDWLTAKPRALSEVIAVMAQAGHGLAAAHAAGVVHRDSKPANGLVGSDGRVRVADFGLAHPVTDVLPVIPHSATVASPQRTASGALIGTPAYMAPEQHQAGAASFASDQFAYCVSFWEAAFGARPFKGETVAELAASTRQGTLPELAGSRAHRRLARLLARGLAPEAKDRYASMDELLAVLERRRVPWPLHLAWASLAALLAMAALFSGRASVLQGTTTCRSPEDALSEVWSAPRQHELAQAFARQPRGEEVWASTQTALDQYAHAWATAEAEACRAARAQSGDLLDRRRACLEERGRDLTALLDIFATADGVVVEHALQATRGLARLAGCTNPDARPALPADPGERARVEAGFQQLSRARALHIAGRIDEAMATAEEVADAARALKFTPLETSAVVWVAEAHSSAGRTPQAIESARRGFDLALAVADHRAALHFAGILAFANAFDRNQLAEALRWVHTGESLLAHAPNEPVFEAKLANAEGNAWLNAGQPDKAVPALDRAIAALVRHDPDDANIGSTLAMAGVAELYLGKVEPARQKLSEALARIQRTLGPEHPEVASTWLNLSLVECARGDYVAAESAARAGYALQQRVLGKDHPMVAYGEAQLAQVLLARGELQGARAAAANAERIARATFGPRHAVSAQLTLAHAEILARSGQPEDALRRIESAREAISAEDPAAVALYEATASLAQRLAHRPQAAVASAKRAVEKLAGAGDEQAALAHQQLGEALLATGELAGARVELEAAEASLRLHPDPRRMIEVRLALTNAHDENARTRLRETLEAWPAGADPALRAKVQAATAR